MNAEQAQWFTVCGGCGRPVQAEAFDDHSCPPDARNGPHDLDQYDIWIDDDEEERDV